MGGNSDHGLSFLLSTDSQHFWILAVQILRGLNFGLSFLIWGWFPHRQNRIHPGWATNSVPHHNWIRHFVTWWVITTPTSWIRSHKREPIDPPVAQTQLLKTENKRNDEQQLPVYGGSPSKRTLPTTCARENPSKIARIKRKFRGFWPFSS